MTPTLRSPMLIAAEYRADAVVHALGLAFAALAAPAVVLTSSGGVATASAAIYAATLIAMFGFSAAYNMILSPRWRETLRRLDHGAIYLKIAGSYTPFSVVSFTPATGGKLLLGVWTVALIGFGVKLAGARRVDFIAIPLYLALGWAMVFVLEEARATMTPAALWLIVAGGLTYTIGVAFHLWQRLPYQTAIWHVHVLIGTACIWGAVMVELGARAA